MPFDSSNSRTTVMIPARVTQLTISRWVNERYPPLNELLSSHDVARLTQRPRWVLIGLCLIGRFPKKLKFRGRGIGWRRSEVIDWMSRDLAVVRESASSLSCRSRRHPRQVCRPLSSVQKLREAVG
jgi:predicted DNA-binding transcriptional regulator AlpA